MNPKKNKLLFLFGAGISKPAKFPLGNELTKSLIDTPSFHLYDKIPNYNITPRYKENSIRFFEAIRFINNYLHENGELSPNYERIYFIADLIANNSRKMDQDNSSLEKEFPLRPELYPFFKLLPQSLNNGNPIYDFYKDVCTYIKEFIRTELLNVDYYFEDVNNKLSVILDSCKSKYFDEINIFTLNHDILLEELLECNKIAYSDGFHLPAEDGYRYWCKGQFYENHKVKLIKLHGSIKWYLKEAIYLVNEIDGHNSNSNDFAYPAGRLPFFLIGTDNKYFDYTDGHIFEMLNYFYETLNSADKLFISGYGFCDHGLNNIIRHIQTYNKKLKVFVIDKNIPQTYIRFEDQNKSETRKYIEDFKFEQLKKLYDEV